MEDDLTKIKVGNHLIGMIGLRTVFETFEALGMDLSPSQCQKKLVELASQSNYIADAAKEAYGKALHLEYRRFLGEEVEEENQEMELLVLGPGCANCEELYQRVLAAAHELNLPLPIRQVKDINEIAQFGPIPTPALIAGASPSSYKTLAAGGLPTKEKLKALIRHAVQN